MGIFWVLFICAIFFIYQAFTWKKEVKKLKEENAALQPYKIVPDVKVYEEKLSELQKEYQSKKYDYDMVLVELGKMDSVMEMMSYGMYRPSFAFDTSEEYKRKRLDVREAQKALIKAERAAVCARPWTVDGSKAEGKKMTQRNIRLMLRAFNGECDSVIAECRWDNIQKMEERIRKSFEAINKMGETNQIDIQKKYLDLKIDELHLAYEYAQKLNEEKEEQRRIKEQMREEEKVRRETEKAMRDAAHEEEILQKAMDKVRAQMEQANEEQRAQYEAQIAELEQKRKEAEERSQRAKSMAEQTKRGKVYIISNIGSFGKDVYKIGMTRRLVPEERIKELGDASVPFAFDIHAMIDSENAPDLETKLHKKFALSQINKVNYRKEFFRLDIGELKKALEADGNIKEVTWTMASEAREYWETLTIEESLKDNPEAQKAWLEHQFAIEERTPRTILRADDEIEESTEEGH